MEKLSPDSLTPGPALLVIRRKRVRRDLKLLSNAISFLERGEICVPMQLSFLFLYWLISEYVRITVSLHGHPDTVVLSGH